MEVRMGKWRGGWTGGKAVRKSCKSGDYIVSVNGMAVSSEKRRPCCDSERNRRRKNILGIMRGENILSFPWIGKECQWKIYAWCLGEGRPCGVGTLLITKQMEPIRHLDMQ